MWIMINKHFVWLVGLLLWSLILTGCGSNSSSSTQSEGAVIAVLAVLDESGVPFENKQVPYGGSFVLSGEGSTDTGGGLIVTYRWTAITATGGGLTQGVALETTAPNLTLSFAGSNSLPVGLYLYELVVVDDSGNESAPAQISLQVIINQAPTANAGLDQSVKTKSVVTLDGSGSSDPNGDTVSYMWTFVSVPAGSGAVFSSVAVAQPGFTADVAGIYVVQLVVNDGTVDSVPDTVTVTVTGSLSWGTAQSAFGPSIGAYMYPQLKADGSGNFFVIWIETDNTGQYTLWANRYDASLGAWETPHQLASPPGLVLSNPRLAVNGAGEAVAVWSEYGAIPGVKNVVVSRYSAGAWGIGQIVDNSSNDTHFPDVAIDSAGSVVVVWHQSDVLNNTLSIVANRYDVSGSTWGTPVLLEQSVKPAFEPRVALDSLGNAMVVWSQDDGVAFSVAANRYNVLTDSWGAVQWIDGTTNAAGNPALAIDKTGNVFVTWWESDGSTAYNAKNSVVVRRFDAGTAGWGASIALDTTSTLDPWEAPVVVAGVNGNVVVAWEHNAYEVSLGAYAHSIYAARYDTTTGWATAAAVDADFYPAVTPSLAMDAAGNALLVWAQQGYVANLGVNRNSVYASTLPVGGVGWSTPEMIEVEDGHGITPQIAIAPTGAALAVWNQETVSSGVYELWENFFR